MLRLALIGNIAQNAYLLAKFFRRLGVAADCFDMGGGASPMWLPWWEEAAFDPTTLHPEQYDWLGVAAETGFRRPAWAKILGNDASAPWYDTQEAFQADLARYAPGCITGRAGESPAEERAAIRAALALGRLAPDEQAACVEGVRQCPAWRSVLALAEGYDLLVLCGPWAGYGAVLPREQKYVTFEHSTMRQVPQLRTPDHRLLAAAYRHADANILTNADCGEAAWCLGLHEGGADRRVFIPHPLDEARFSPGEDAQSRATRAAIEEAVPGAALVLYAPARQSSSVNAGCKRNDRALYAVARYVAEAEPAGAPRAALVLARWGEPPDIKAAEDLVIALGLRERVLWSPCLPKPRVLAHYRAADIVLDQFSEAVGSFGTVTAEALSCGRPVITYINPQAHEWCLAALGGELPPVLNCLAAPEIYGALRALANSPSLRASYGRQGRHWIEAQHGWRHVAGAHLALYARVLGIPVEALTAPSAPAPSVDVRARLPHEPVYATPRPAPTARTINLHWTDAGLVGTSGTIAAPVVREAVTQPVGVGA